MEEPLQPRLRLINDVSQTFDKLPPINLLRAAANAKTLYPAFIQYLYLFYKPLELDRRTERLIVLYVGKLSDCIYIWRGRMWLWRHQGAQPLADRVLAGHGGAR